MDYLSPKALATEIYARLAANSSGVHKANIGAPILPKAFRDTLYNFDSSSSSGTST